MLSRAVNSFQLKARSFTNKPLTQYFKTGTSSFKLNMNYTSKYSFSSFYSVRYSQFAKKIMKVPSLGDSISEGTIQTYHKKEGEMVNVDDVICSIETDKVTVELKSELSGVITKYFVTAGSKIDVGANFVEIDSDAKASAKAAPQAEAPKAQAAPQAAPTQQAKAAPPQPQAQAAPKATPPPQPQAQAPPKATPPPQKVDITPGQPQRYEAKGQGDSKPITFTGARTEYREKMSRLRQRVSDRLKGSQNTYATLTTFNECDMSAAITMRNEYQDLFLKKHGIKLGFMSFFLKASSIALEEMPVLNAVIDGQDIVYRDYIDISVAVAAPTGLLVPVIRNCENKNFAEFETILRDLGNKARDNKIKVEDMAGGTFTVSNGGVYGSMLGTPIINPPQTAILGLHSIQNRAVVRDNAIVARPIMYLALSYDHRLIDGREAVLFLKRIKELVEDPRKMLVNV